MLQVIQHAVHLVEHALGVLVLHAQLIAVGLADGAGLIRPLIPDVPAQVVDVVRLLLPDPQQLVHGGLPVGAAQREERKLLGEIIAVHDAEFLHRVRRSAVVLPARAHLAVGVPDAVCQNLFTVLNEYLICVAHSDAPLIRFLSHNYISISSCAALCKGTFFRVDTSERSAYNNIITKESGGLP